MSNYADGQSQCYEEEVDVINIRSMELRAIDVWRQLPALPVQTNVYSAGGIILILSVPNGGGKWMMLKLSLKGL